jgi:hypothetical protein
MKQIFFIIFILSLFIACSTEQEITQYMTRKFFINEYENSSAWSRANLAIFNRAWDHVVTTTVSSVAAYYETCYVTRAQHGNGYEYTVVGRNSREAQEIECEIRGIKDCDSFMNDASNGNNNQSQLKTQEKNRAKARKLPNGIIIFE